MTGQTTGNGPAAGWYDDPELAKTRRYWDGERWTDHRQEKAAVPASDRSTDDGYPSYAVASTGLVLAVILPVVGFLIGLVLLTKRGNDGLKIVIVSIVAGLAWLWIYNSVQSESEADRCRISNNITPGSDQDKLICQ